MYVLACGWISVERVLDQPFLATTTILIFAASIARAQVRAGTRGQLNCNAVMACWRFCERFVSGVAYCVPFCGNDVPGLSLPFWFQAKPGCLA